MREQSITQPHHLSYGTILHDKYWIGEAIGEGGFGITYVGQDQTLDLKVAVKEYYPTNLVNRNHTSSARITANVGAAEEIFSKGKENFLKEARILAKFSAEPNIVCVRDFFEENNTAYIVMDYLEGITLKEYVEQTGRMSFEKAYEILSPIMKALDKVHSQGLIHRDISPSNIMILNDRQVKLLDFGAARDFSNLDGRSLSVMLKPGYAPEEQYRTKGLQGPWTDVYAICATMYKMVTGMTPEDAMNRVFEDELKRPSGFGCHITSDEENVLLKGMSVNHRDRYPDMGTLQRALEESLKSEAISRQSEITDQPNVLCDEYDERTVAPDHSHDAYDDRTVAPDHSYDERTIAEDAVPQYREEKTVMERQPEQKKTVESRKKQTKETKEKKTEKSSKPKKKKKAGKTIGKILGITVGIAAAAVIGLIVYQSFNVVNIGDQKVHKSETSLSIFGDQIPNSDMQKLKKLKKLDTLRISTCFLDNEDVETLSELTGLKKLYLDNNTDITDVSPLNRLTQLEELSLVKTKTEDISCLDKLVNLKRLNIDKTKVSDLSCLEQYPNLSALNMSGLKKLNADTIKLPESLKELNCMSDRLENLAFLETVPNLTTINAAGNALTEIEILGKYENIYSVTLNYNNIADISPIAKETISNLSVTNNQIADISCLRSCTRISLLTLANNNITDISALEEKTGLHQLDVSHNQIEDISPLKDDFNLYRLDISNNNVEDISAVATIDALEHLEAGHNRIMDISPVGENKNLMEKAEVVSFENNQISDISVLAKYKNLEYVYLSNNLIEDVSAFSVLKGLTLVKLNSNQIKDTAGISGVKILEVIDNPIETISTDVVKAVGSGSLDKAVLRISYNEKPDWDALAKKENTTVVIYDAPERAKKELKEKGFTLFPNFAEFKAKEESDILEKETREKEEAYGTSEEESGEE